MKKQFPNALIPVFFIFVMALNACTPQTASAGSLPAPTAEDVPVAPAAAVAATTATAAPSALSAILSEITGKVETKQAKQGEFKPAAPNSFLDENGQAMTGSDGRVRLDLSTGTIVRLAPDSLFTLVSNEPADGSLKTRIQMAFGDLFVILNGGSLEVETPTGTAAVRGSFMSVSFDETSGQIRITCLEGHCSLKGAGGSVDITAGQTAVISGAGQPPQIGEMSAEDIQAWLDMNPEALIMVNALNQSTKPTVTPQPGRYIPPAVIIDEDEEGEPQPTSSPVPTLVPVVTISNVTPTSSTVGESVAVSVNVAPSGGGPMPTGTVKVRAGASYFCAASLDSGGNAICSGGIPAAGSHDLTADYLGDASYLTASSPSFVGFYVSQAATSTTLYPPSFSLAGTAVTFTATVDVISPGAGTPYGSVTFSDSDGINYCPPDTSAPWECTFTFTIASQYPVVANYSGDSNFNGSSSVIIYHEVLASTDTEFRSPSGPTGTIAACLSTYQVQALDISGTNTVELEYRIGDNVFTVSDVRQALIWNTTTQFWEGSFTIPALSTDTVYWRFIATDGGGNKTFLGNDITYTTGYTGAAVDAYSYTGLTCP